MPPYFKNIWKHRCGHPGCQREATRILMSARNEVVTHYCRGHGDDELAVLNAEYEQ